ncbi:MAG: alkaline phosphatase D family protein [Parvularculaceae bacterium]|nr:alkaline phosphatase D family protein [Parvularculaceae bacterium]
MIRMKSVTLFAAFAMSACATAGAPDDVIPLSSEAPGGAIRAVPISSAPLNISKSLSRIVFASCAQQNEDQSLWDRVAGENADLLLYIGDNVYGDVRSNDSALPELKAAYMRLANSAPFARARAASPMLTTWDDHDYGMNDAGGDYRYKEQSEALFEYVWNVKDDRSKRPGVYGSWLIGEEGKRVQIIMLDTRYFRSPLKPTDEQGARGKERWLPDPDPAKTMLGAAQWAWLEEELKKPADLRLLVSSIQVMSEGHGWEAWREFPLEREKLYDVIERAAAKNVMILSGDRHSAALYERKDVIGYPLFEATSSSINLPAAKWRAESGETYVEQDPNRLGAMIYDANYGVIDIDWSAKTAAFTIRSATGATFLAATRMLDN